MKQEMTEIKRKKRIKSEEEIVAEQVFYATIGSKIKELREKAGITQKMIAQELGFQQSFVALVERGQKVPLFQLQRILERIGHTIDFPEKKTLCNLN